ncbi:MAG: hypothetical protein K9G76_01570 [Bacteroidales bacterium]|nr:hypothetical protein [Bacteroidales bacterium]MCF8403242.1 hypothetical protein [Bacteroidales bacterium]
MNVKNRKNSDKKQSMFNSPNLSKMQEVVIDARTRIYIELDADPIAARDRYLARLKAR